MVGHQPMFDIPLNFCLKKIKLSVKSKMVLRYDTAVCFTRFSPFAAAGMEMMIMVIAASAKI